jgi:hypothetical protein
VAHRFVITLAREHRLIFLGGHAAFQAILHILSELRNPLFNAPDRSRALRTLQMSRLLKENNHTKAWSVVKGMIDKAIDESAMPKPTHSESSGSRASPPNVPLTAPVPFDYQMSYHNQLPPYVIQKNLEPFIQQPVQVPAELVLQPEQPVFNWDDLHLNNIVGDVPQNPELPEFDWVRCS